MASIETDRLILRPFTTADWADLRQLAVDWQAAPGPAFDKLPTTEQGCRELTDYLAQHERYVALCLRTTQRVVGLLALNGLDDKGQFDLGHIIHSAYQDNDLDREAIAALVDLIFQDASVATIVTHNADYPPQLAPLLALGFHPGDAATGELLLERITWAQRGMQL